MHKQKIQRIKEYFNKLFSENPKIKKAVGVILVFVGFIGLITPFTPWGFLFFVGLEMLGGRIILWDKVKKPFKKKKAKTTDVI